MAKSILTPEGDPINYDNLIAVSVEVRSVGVDDEHTEDAYCIVGTDVTNRGDFYFSPAYEKEEEGSQGGYILCFQKGEFFSFLRCSTAEEGGDA